VDHPPRGHDDLANAVAGVASMLLSRKRGVTWSDIPYTLGDDDNFPPRDPRVGLADLEGWDS
jgi:hypothetical protein